MQLRLTWVVLSCAVFVQASVAARELCLGTFSDLAFNKEGGDLLGVEVKIVETRTGKQAAVQFSEGEPGPLQLAEVTCEGNRVVLQIAAEKGSAPITFKGTVRNNSLVGEFVFDTGAKQAVKLPRRKGYWD